MGIFTRPGPGKLPGAQVPESIQQDTLENFRENISETAGGALGMFLGEGGRERATEAFNKFLKPVTPYLGFARMLGASTGAEGDEALAKSMALSRGGKVDKTELRNLYDAINEKDNTYGYNQDQRGRAVQQLAAMGRLPELQRGHLGSYKARKVADKVEHYLRSAAIMGQTNKRPMLANLGALVRGTQGQGIDPRHLPNQTRMEQLKQRWMT